MLNNVFKCIDSLSEVVWGISHNVMALEKNDAIMNKYYGWKLAHDFKGTYLFKTCPFITFAHINERLRLIVNELIWGGSVAVVRLKPINSFGMW